MTNLTQTTQNINIVPQRIASDHYRTRSFTNPNKTYDQHFNYELKQWDCTCRDFEKNHNTNCKHNILLRACIKKEKAQQAPALATELHHSNSAELISILERIAKLENAMSSVETEQHLVECDLEEHKYQLDTRSEQEKLLRNDLIKQQKQIDRQADLISALQTSVCRLNERTIRQDEAIKKLLVAHDQLANFAQEMYLKAQEYKSMLEDQAQQIDKLHDQVSSQQKSEQVVRVVVEPATRGKREADEPKAMEIREIRDEHGKLTACKVGRFTVRVFGNSAGDCDCSTGLLGKQCPHVVAVDRYITSK